MGLIFMNLLAMLKNNYIQIVHNKEGKIIADHLKEEQQIEKYFV